MSQKPWLVVIDMQVVFAVPDSPWFTPGYRQIEPVVESLARAFGDRVVYTRFVAPEHPQGEWRQYYRQWPFALTAENDQQYDLMPAFAEAAGSRAAGSQAAGSRSEGFRAPVVTCTTFGKWGAELRDILGPDATMVLAGVSTDCCVLSTALAAADAGVRVRVVTDACAGVSESDHERALATMALYAPLIELITARDALKGTQ